MVVLSTVRASCVMLVVAVGCGGSAPVSPSVKLPLPVAPAALLTGTVSGVNGAVVSTKCASGTVSSVTTDPSGDFSVDVTGATLPCMLEVRGGRTLDARNDLVLHAVCDHLGGVIISPFTELAVANGFGALPSAVFASYDGGSIDGSTFVDAALADAGLTADQLVEALQVADHSLNDLVGLAVSGASWREALTPAATTWVWALPDTLVAPVVPTNNAMSTAKVELGHFLFFDQRLSGNGSYSCGSCHDAAKAFTDGRALAIGSTAESNTRSAQGLANVAFNPTLTWEDPRLRSLETQMLVPLFGTHPVEMGVTDANRGEVIERLRGDTQMMARFNAAFPNQDAVLSWHNVIKAIAAFERTLLSGNSRYEQAIKNRGPLLTAAETRGEHLFFNTAQCFRCHGNFNFTDTVSYAKGPAPELRFHNTGLFNIGGTGAFPAPNRGIFEFTAVETDMGQFRAPSLRNIELTAPYMHDGSIATLEAVLDFYGAHGRVIADGPNAGDGRANPYKDPIVNNITLTDQDKADLVAFLKTLTDTEFVTNPKFANPF